VLAILVLEYGIGVYVSLYATVPSTDRGAGIATAIARGPAALSTHAVLGLLLGLGAIAVLVQAGRRPAVLRGEPVPAAPAGQHGRSRHGTGLPSGRRHHRGREVAGLMGG
jgi:hypothetical protein